MSGKDFLLAFRLLADSLFPGDPPAEGVAFCFFVTSRYGSPSQLPSQGNYGSVGRALSWWRCCSMPGRTIRPRAFIPWHRWEDGSPSSDSARRKVARPLEQRHLPEARRQMGWHPVSRDVSGLEGSLIAAATIESLAENTSDSVIAPLFWFAALVRCALRTIGCRAGVSCGSSGRHR